MAGPEAAAGALLREESAFGSGKFGCSGSNCRRILPAFGTCCATAGPTRHTIKAVAAAHWTTLFGLAGGIVPSHSCGCRLRLGITEKNLMSEHKGKCFCGAVSFSVSGDPVVMGYCHCESCRHWSGGPVNAFTLWQPTAVSITRGANLIGTH